MTKERYILIASNDAYSKQLLKNSGVKDCEYDSNYPYYTEKFTNINDAIKAFNNFKLGYTEDSNNYYIENVCLRKLADDYINDDDYVNDNEFDNKYSKSYDLDLFEYLKDGNELNTDSKWLIEQRNKFNITQQQLADAINISVYAIANIEQNQRKGSIDTWIKINKYFTKLDD